MKKFLITLSFLYFSVCALGQIKFSEFYVQPNDANITKGYRSEFFELINSSSSTDDNTDGYILLTLFERSATEKGWYVMDLPSKPMEKGGSLFLGASNNPFLYQDNTNPAVSHTADYNWNDNSVASASLTKWVLSGSCPNYVNSPVTPPLPSAEQNDIFSLTQSHGSEGKDFVMILLKKDPAGSTINVCGTSYAAAVMADGFIGGYNNTQLPSYVQSYPPIIINYKIGGVAQDPIVFNPKTVVQWVNSVPSMAGTDNGYYDKCGDWQKSSAPKDHTPGTANYGSGGATFNVSAHHTCDNTSVCFTVTGGTSSVYPVSAALYKDDGDNALDPTTDALIGTQADIIQNAGEQCIPPYDPSNPALDAGRYFLVVFSKKACGTKITTVDLADPLFVDAQCGLSGMDLTVSGGNTYPVTAQYYSDYSSTGDPSLPDAMPEIHPAPDDILRSGISAIFNAPGSTTISGYPGDAGEKILFQASCGNIVVPVSCDFSVLPVTLASFNVQRNGSKVELSWQTASEMNNKGFYIQRKEANSDWQNIAFVNSKAANGNSDITQSYTFTDINSVKSVLQYRLLQVDYDGRGKYSEIRSIRGLDQASTVLVFPNPSANGIVNVLFEDATGLRNIIVSDMAGRILQQFKGITSNSLQLNQLNKGVYSIRIQNLQTGQQTIQKVLVQ